MFYAKSRKSAGTRETCNEKQFCKSKRVWVIQSLLSSFINPRLKFANVFAKNNMLEPVFVFAESYENKIGLDSGFLHYVICCQYKNRLSSCDDAHSSCALDSQMFSHKHRKT